MVTYPAMAFRYSDFECTKCGTVDAKLYETPHGMPKPKFAILECRNCETERLQERLISMPAQYMGEKTLNPNMRGGNYDTMGHAPMPDIPDLPGAKEHDQRLAAELATVPDGPSAVKDANGKESLTELGETRKAIITKHRNNAPSEADYHAHLHKPEVSEIFKERDVIKKQNREKRQRSAAIKRGENINMRRDKCAGDPKITA